VIRPTVPPHASTTYSIKIDPTKIKDKQGDAVTNDANGPIRTTYSFTTEGLYPIPNAFTGATAVSPDFTSPDAMGNPTKVAPDDAFLISLNANVDPATVTDGIVTVKAADGSTVAVHAFLDQGGDPTMCIANPRQVDIVPAAGAWAAGTYSITVAGIKSDTGAATLATDVTGKTLGLSGKFTSDPATMATNPAEMVVGPAQCAAPAPADGGAPVDGGM
jgi:hypothetical protein